ncbi:RIP metalloprotease RseP [Falsiroseomonas selenitidurans]|uniref:Zinc metalloprotease n=1 Tax=Falsiroseomonas selenitidurans TaxID=2716335 RepID=A0ABX1E019_9PROT|nr:RIP metalloprotease RseP [Falsiroseomonas selenitidurans]NKC30426.1 RIP metalloprotease RseP [Falsiroseomonas selenitidurans]
MPEPIRTILAFVVVLGVLVFFHELGHYLAARWRGVHVERFSVGFGRAIANWTDRQGTEWRIGWLPLGGYVKLHGQEQPEDVPEAVRATWRPGQTFHEKPVRDRAIVVAAGPLANFLLAALMFGALFATVGRPAATTAIGSVQEGSAAAAAGLLPGDRIVALDGQPVLRFEEVQRHIQPRANTPVAVTVERDGAERTLTATPAPRSTGETTVGVLGVGAAATQFERLNPATALWAGVVQTGDITVQTLGALWQMIAGGRGAEELGGPLRIAQMSGQVAELGIASLISFMAVLSVNLALINLFPIPVLDGGHLMFYAAEAIRGRPLPPKAQEYGFRAGFALLITLFVFATWNDLSQLGVVRWATGLFG